MVHFGLHIVTIDNEAFVALQHQGLYPAIEKIIVKCLLPESDSLLHITVFSKLLASKETEITGHKMEAIKKVSHNLPAVCHEKPQVWFVVFGPVISFSVDPLKKPVDTFIPGNLLYDVF